MRQTDGVILEAIYYNVVRTLYACCTRVVCQRAPTKQMLLYLPSKTKCGSQQKFKSKVDDEK